MTNPAYVPLETSSTHQKSALNSGKQRKILISSNGAWNLANFRRPVIERLVAAGYEVVAAAPADGHERSLEALGARFSPLLMRAAGTSPVDDSRLLLQYITLLRAERPAYFLGFTAKPNIYGSLAARITGVPTIATISGLGSAFLKGGLLGRLVLGLYRAALAKAQAVVFQNADDRDLFVERHIARPDQARLVAGSGIDLDRFAPVPLPAGDGFTFLLIARLLRDKGIVEFVEAARQLRVDYPNARFQLLGGPGGDNPSAVPEADLARWAAESIVERLGVSDDVRPAIAAADCVVLPSYREGLPRSLLEGAAMGRPLIASDVPGCRDVVDHQVNGLLCEVRSAVSLAAAMRRMIDLPLGDRVAMGMAGRHKVAAEYDQRLVADFYLSEIAR